MKAWYFAQPDEKLAYGDGREIKVGHSHTVDGKPTLCKLGLHGSVKLLDALLYSSSSILYRVSITGDVAIGGDKICGQHRKYLYRVDIVSILCEFARKQALINIEKIKPFCSSANYAIIMQWLETGNESVKQAASSAARAAAYSAASSTARSAANTDANQMLTEMVEAYAKQIN